MAFDFANTARISTTNPTSKVLEVLAVKLTFADFTTGGTAAVKAVLPADASIVGFRFWQKTTMSGNGVTAATLSIGVSGAATRYVNAVNAMNSTNGYTAVSVSNIMQQADPANRTDMSLLFTGTATTGNPTAGELYVLIEFVR